LMRTVEVLFVIMIILGAFIVATQFAVLPSPSQIFGTNLRELAVSTLQTLDASGDLSTTVFESSSDQAWGTLENALSASLPPNIVYNLSVYEISSSSGVVNYTLVKSISDAEGDLGAGSEAASYLVTSSNVTFSINPEKIGEKSGQNITLYILNCEDANGWWITGYTGQTLASDCYNLLSPYFETTVLVNTTEQLEFLLENSTQIGGTIQNAVVINTFGEAVPIPSNYCEGGTEQSKGYQSGTYAKYCHTLGVRTRLCNWTWVSIVGYPLYYVTNTETLKDYHNGYRIYGMRSVGAAGLNAFLQGIDDQGYWHNTQWLTADIKEQLEFTSEARDLFNYYGIYPAPSPMASRALPVTGPLSIEWKYDLTRQATMFKLKTVSGNKYSPAATFSHNGGGALTAIGLTRIPDIRITVLDLLMYYRPQIYRSEFGASGTSRLVTLQLGQQGGT
jgi:hypothetical protein